MERPQHYRFHQGQKALPFTADEYEARLAKLRASMAEKGIDACVLTSMHNVAYYSGFLYCAFGRPYGLVVTAADNVTFSAGIDAAQPWRRSHGDNITFTDWERNNYWRAVLSLTGSGKSIGYEADHLTIYQMSLMDEFLAPDMQSVIRSKRACARLMLQWLDVMQWSWKLPSGSQMQNTATHGFGSNQESTQTVPTIQSQVAHWSVGTS